MNEIRTFATIVLVVEGGFLLALAASKVSERFRIPAPALFLLAAALASDVFPRLADHVPIRTVERIGVVALIIILFDGGMIVGWRRFRTSALPITVVGIVGTFATAAAIALVAHLALDLDWTTAGIIGAALCPTDPAVTFSVLGNREIAGRSGAILEGESGVNDPVGIAIMVVLLDYATGHSGSIASAVLEFLLEMAVGLAVGFVGAMVLLQLMRRVTLPSEGLYPIRTLAAAGVIYGATTLAHGSGFLAVFVAGILIGDERTPYKAEVERFHTALASLAEIVVFVVLGLTIDLTDLFTSTVALEGLLIAAALAFVVRPLVVGPLLAPFRLTRGERLFVMWGGLRGAVPILLAALAVDSGIAHGDRVYNLVFVVVAFSVLVQGSTFPLAARLLGVRMRSVEPKPWDFSIRLPQEPERDLERYVVRASGRAAGRAIRDLPISEHAWISLVVHEGEPVEPRGSYVLSEGDEVHVLSEPDDRAKLRRFFEGRTVRADSEVA
jgi:potassium/hydrogen antiporter